MNTTDGFPLEGGCTCRRVRYRMLTRPLFVHCCHCLDCQKQTGGAFAINALIEADRVELLQGEPEGISMPTESGKPHIVYRCSNCQVALWSIYGGRQQVRFIRVATLDEPHAIEPDVHIFTRSKVPWVVLPEGVRAFEVYYQTETEWPAESFARRKAAYAKS